MTNRIIVKISVHINANKNPPLEIVNAIEKCSGGTYIEPFNPI